MSDPIILCVDDDTTVLNALRTVLSTQLGHGHLVEIAESGAEALEIVEDFRSEGREVCVVIADFIMPGMRGDELLVRIHAISPRTVTILLTGQSDVDGIKRAINEANLYRFLEKPFDNYDLVLTARTAQRAYTQDREVERQNEILRRINEALEGQVASKERQLEEKNRELERLATTDRLTGVFNRLKLDQVLGEERVRTDRYGGCFSVLMLDVDKFKTVNDTHGHNVGDQVLATLAQLLSTNSREADVVGRWGGEEFLVVCRNTPLESAMVLAESLRKKIMAHTFPTVHTLTTSVGVTSYRTGDTVIDILDRADKALYRAKEKGRNCVESHP